MTHDRTPSQGTFLLSRAAALLALVSLGACAVGANGARSYHPIPADGDEQPHGMLYLRGGVGTATVDTDTTGGGNSEVDTDAFYGEFGVEGVGRVMGGGVRISGYQSDDELGGVGANTTLTNLSVFPHLTIRPGGGRFRIPIRIGPEVRVHNIEDTTPGLSSETDYSAIGLALEVEPEIDFVRSDRFALSIYGRAHGGYAAANVDFNNTDYSTTAVMVTGEAGLRLQLAKFLISGGYIYQATNFDVSDPESGALVTNTPEQTLSFNGAFLLMGLRW